MKHIANTLRICLVIEPSGGGSGRHVLDLAAGLSGRGHEVTVLWSPIRAQNDWAEELKSLARVNSVPVDMFRSAGLNDWQSLKALTKTIRQAGPFDILHGHSSKAGALVRLLPASIPGKRVYTPHAYVTMDPQISRVKKLIYKSAERLLSTRGDATIAVSAAEVDHAKRQKMSRAPVKIVNGVNGNTEMTRTQARQEMGLSDGAFAVGFVGRLSYQKYPERFVDVIKKACALQPRIKGVIIGDGEIRTALEQDAINQPSNISFLGWQNAPALMSGLDLFFMSSRYEAMPYTLLEALCAGLPIFSTRVGGVDEAIRTRQNGLVFEQDCENEVIAQALASLANDTARYEQWSAASLKLSNQYSIDAMVSQTEQLYFSLLRTRHSAASQPTNTCAALTPDRQGAG